MADHIWKEKWNHLPLCDQAKIIDREEHLKVRCLKEVVHMLGYSDQLSGFTDEYKLGTINQKRLYKLISDLLLWTPSHGQAKAGRPAWTYIQQLCVDTGCSPKDLPEGWRKRVGDIRADGATW